MAARAMRSRCFRDPECMVSGQRSAVAVTSRAAEFPPGKEARMVPLLLWILGVPGLIIILLLLLGVLHI